MAIIKYNQCVLTQILDDAPCGGALTQLIDEHGLTLTPAQQLNLVGLGGSVGNMCGENSDFEDLVVEELINGCHIDQMADFLIGLNLSVSQANAVCGNNNQPATEPSCESCNEEQLQQIIEANETAIEWLDCALGKIENFEESTSAETQSCFDTSFNGDTSPITLQYLEAMIQLMKNGISQGQEYSISTGTDYCELNPTVPAYTEFTSGQFEPIHDIIFICPVRWATHDDWGDFGEEWPNYYRSRDIIHEISHLYVYTLDIAYTWDSAYEHLNNLEHSNNADSYTNLISCLCSE